MLRVALKGLLAHKLRFLLTTAGVVIGVTLVAGSLVLTDTMDAAFEELFELSYEGSDLFITAESSFEVSAAEWDLGGPTMDEELVDRVAEVDGVAEASGLVAGYASFIAPDGDPILPQAPTLAFSWGTEASLGAVSLRSGDAPVADGQVTMDAGTFESYGFELGHRVDVIVRDGVETFELVGTTGFGESDNLLGATIATFEFETARRLFDKQGQVDEVSVVGDGTLDTDELRDRVAEVVGADGVVTTTADRAAAEQEDVSEALGFLSTFLLAVAGISLFVAAFLITNIFSVVVAQRSREFALLRAVGASRRQVQTAVLGEALVVGLASSVVGLGLGIGLGALIPAAFSAAGLDLPTGNLIVAPRTVIAAFVIGTGVTVLASLLPARRASRVPPVEALRGAATAPSAPLGRRTAIGAVLTVLGGAVLFAGLTADVPEPVALVGLGAAAAFVGVALLAPIVADPVVRLAGWPASRWSVAGKIARGNARRDPRRTAATASALMIGLALVSAVTILAASIQASVNDALDEQFRADLVLQGDQTGMRPIPVQVAADLAADPAIAEVSPVRVAQASVNGDVETFVGVDPETIDDLLVFDVTGGFLDDLAADTIALDDAAAAAHGVAIGDRLPLVFRDGSEDELTLVATFESSEFLGTGYLLALDALEGRVGAQQGDLLVLANASGDLGPAREAVEAAAQAAPAATVRDQAEFRQMQADQIQTVLNVLLVLLVFAVVIALIGITATLALAVIERTREIGLLRAVGMERDQTRRMVLWESLFVGTFGAVLGIAVGTFLAWSLVQAMADEGVSRFVVPGQVAGYLLVAVVCGMLAAVLPAVRAAKLDVLEAVTVE